MQLVEQNSSRRFTFQQVGVSPVVPANSGDTETNLYEMRIDKLRDAIRENEVSFPSQVPTFPNYDRPDLQRKLVQLYFVLGWSGAKIGARYSLSGARVQQILNAWKRRAVGVGYVQTVPPADIFIPSSEHPPIQVVLSPVLNSSSASVIRLSVPSPVNSGRLTDEQVPSLTDHRRGHRPRRKFGTSKIARVLEQLRAGRTVAETADEVGVSARTIRIWKEQHEMRLLRSENAELKERLANLGAVEKTLIDLITRSNNVQSPAFMPFSRV